MDKKLLGGGRIGFNSNKYMLISVHSFSSKYFLTKKREHVVISFKPRVSE